MTEAIAEGTRAHARLRRRCRATSSASTAARLVPFRCREEIRTSSARSGLPGWRRLVVRVKAGPVSPWWQRRTAAGWRGGGGGGGGGGPGPAFLPGGGGGFLGGGEGRFVGAVGGGGGRL